MARKQAKPTENGAGVATAEPGPEVVWKGNDLLRPFLIPIADLREDPENANVHPDRSLEEIAGSYLRFGQQKPLVADATGLIKDGNGQLIAAHGLGWTHVAVFPSDLSGSELKAYGLAVNQTARSSEWDFEKLAAQLKELEADGASIADLGWSPHELEPLLQADWQPAAVAPLPEAVMAGAGAGVSVGGINGPAPGMAVPIAVTTAQRELIGAALDRVRELEHDPEMSEGRGVEMICASYLSRVGYPGSHPDDAEGDDE